MTLIERIAAAQAEGLASNVQRWLDFLGVVPGDIVEVQALGIVTRTRRGDSRYAHATSSAHALRLLVEAERWNASGLYMIANRCDPRVAARSTPNEWHVAQQGTGTSDRDILARRTLPIDLDVSRPSGISATDAEVAQAFEVADAVLERIAAIVDPRAIGVGHSGNGIQLHVALASIPEDDDVHRAVKGILAALDILHSTAAIKVDRSLSDPKRILPAWGTTKRKGAHTDERPHRTTAIVCAREPVRLDRAELLALAELFVDLAPAAAQQKPGARAAAAPTATKPQLPASATPTGKRDESPFDRANAIPIADVAAWLGLVRADGGAMCPRGCHDRGAASSVAFLRDANRLKCSHATCASVGPHGGGVRTCVDLVAEARGVDPKEAVRALAEHFGFEGFTKKKRDPKPEKRERTPPPDNGVQPWPDMLRYTKQGPASSLRNCALVLEHDTRWSGVFGYDTRFDRLQFMKAPPVEALADTGPFPRQITDSDETEIATWLEDVVGVDFAATKVHSAIMMLAHRNAFDRVVEYLEALEWDGVERIDTWLVTFAGVEDTPLHRAFGRKWLISAVARALVPGSKVDHVLVLEAQQGARKSSALRALCADSSWFSDSLGDIARPKEAGETLQGPWIIEIGELDAMSRAEATTIKHFITKQTDRYRPAYGRCTVDHPRRCVFAGTTNDDHYLKDATGGRRFWPVATGPRVDVDGIVAARDAFWSEAVAAFRAGERWYLEDEQLEAQAADVQEERQQSDEWGVLVEQHLRERYLEVGPELRITVGECLRAIGLGPKEWGRADEMRVGNLLKRLRWKRVRRRDGEEKVLRWAYEPPRRFSTSVGTPVGNALGTGREHEGVGNPCSQPRLGTDERLGTGQLGEVIPMFPSSQPFPTSTRDLGIDGKAPVPRTHATSARVPARARAREATSYTPPSSWSGERREKWVLEFGRLVASGWAPEDAAFEARRICDPAWSDANEDANDGGTDASS